MAEWKALGADTLLADGEMQQVTVEGAREGQVLCRAVSLRSHGRQTDPRTVGGMCGELPAQCFAVRRARAGDHEGQRCALTHAVVQQSANQRQGSLGVDIQRQPQRSGERDVVNVAIAEYGGHPAGRD